MSVRQATVQMFLGHFLVGSVSFIVPDNCPRLTTASQRLPNATGRVFTVGGLFSIHQQDINPITGKTECTATSPSLKPRFHRNAVEQAEALILAVETINSNPEILPNVTLQYAMWDTCGLLHSQCADDQARALVENSDVIGTVLGPYFYEGSETHTEYDVVGLYKQVVSHDESSSNRRAAIPFIDIPYVYRDSGFYLDMKENLVYLQQSCILQARAAVDFLDRVGWQEVSVVVSDDNCGSGALQEFHTYMNSQGLECSLDPIYYQEAAPLRSRSRRGTGSMDDPFRGQALDLLELHIAKPAAPRAVVLLSSISHANEFFNAFYHPVISSRDTFSFLLGDFWGEPEHINELYTAVLTLRQEAKHVVSLRSQIKGIEKFQDHMTSLRWNSTNVQKNSFLKKYWEDEFNCTIEHNTCHDDDHLNPVVRPILRNSVASLVIDSVYMLAAYLDEFLKIHPNWPVVFSTERSIFRQNQVIAVTNISSWTGNMIGLDVPNTGRLEWVQPGQWVYDFLLLDLQGENVTLDAANNYSLLGTWEFNDGDHMIEINDDMTIWRPAMLITCPSATTTATLAAATTQSTNPPSSSTPQKHIGQTPTSTVSPNPCSHTKLMGLVAIPLIVAVFLIFLSVIFIGLKRWSFTRRSALSPGTLLLIIDATAATVLATLVVFNIFPALECDNLLLDFLINVFGCACYAALLVELLSRKIGGILERFPARLTLYVIVFSIQCVLSGLAFFSLNTEHNLFQTDAAHCLEARQHTMVVIAYWYNVILNVFSVVLLLVAYCGGDEPYLLSKPQVVLVVAVTCCVLYAAAVSMLLWSADCLIHAGFLIITAIYPAIVTLVILGMATVAQYVGDRRFGKRGIPTDLSVARGGLPRVTSHHYVGDPDRNRNAIILAFDNFWDDDIIKAIHEVLIEPRRLKTGKKIGKGNFGEVFKGKLDGSLLVAVKSVQDRLNRSELNSFVREGLQMKNFKHPNVMELYGICWSDDPMNIRHVCPLIVLPYMELGDLKNFLRQRRPGQQSHNSDLPSKEPLTLLQLVKFAHQIARGMAYIAEKDIVHRDLAARNCMVNWDLEIKVADFGLARSMGEGKEYYRMGQTGELPIRWMALESLLDMVFTTKTDVWSFGVTLWELMTLAQLPYPGRQNQDVLPLLRNGHRLEKPEDCPQEIYALMYRCWDVNSEARPSFPSIVRDLEDFLLELMSYFDPMAPSNPYQTWNPVQEEGTEEAEEEKDLGDLVVDMNLRDEDACAEVFENEGQLSNLNQEIASTGRIEPEESGVVIKNPMYDHTESVRGNAAIDTEHPGDIEY